MKEKRQGASLDAVRKSWREVHLKGVACGGWVQSDDGKWEAKKC